MHAKSDGCLVISVQRANAVFRGLYLYVLEEFVPRNVSRGSAVAQDRCVVRSGEPVGRDGARGARAVENIQFGTR